MQAMIVPLLQRATREFQDESRYKNDPRYLRMWIRYVDTVQAPPSSSHELALSQMPHMPGSDAIRAPSLSGSVPPPKKKNNRACPTPHTVTQNILAHTP